VSPLSLWIDEHDMTAELTIPRLTCMSMPPNPC
jgi:hypothetical protein